MRLYPIALIPLVLAIVAFALGVSAEGIQKFLIIGVAAATILVSTAILFTYSRKSPEANQIPLENFSLWADIGEPGVELRRLTVGDNDTATRIIVTDLDSLSANAELLGSRIYMLTGRVGFETLRAEKIHRRVDNLVGDINAVTKKVNAEKSLTAEVVKMVEQCAAQSDRIANKLFDFKSEKSEIIGLYIEPLRRAAEKLSRDLRLESVNISNFLRTSQKVEAPVAPKAVPEGAPKVELPLPPKVEAPSAPSVVVPAELRIELPPPPKKELPSPAKPEEKV